MKKFKNWWPKNSTHRVVSSIFKAAALIHGHTVFSIEEEAIVALTALRTCFGTLGRIGDAGACYRADVGTHFVFAVCRTLHG